MPPQRRPRNTPRSNAGRDKPPRGDEADDPLGKLLDRYQPNLIGMLIGAGFLFCVGIAAIVLAPDRQRLGMTCLFLGSVAILAAVAIPVMNIFNFGRRLELRKHGVRFVEFGRTTELLWDEIADVAVNRTDDTNLGLATVRRQSADAVSPSGLLTKTEWHVTIHGSSGRRIRLTPMFLRTVRDPKSLIKQLRLRAGCV